MKAMVFGYADGPRLQEASGHATKKQTVEEALRVMISLRRQQDVDSAFGKYDWRGNLARSRKGRGAG
jgi:hypothetical protein